MVLAYNLKTVHLHPSCLVELDYFYTDILEMRNTI